MDEKNGSSEKIKVVDRRRFTSEGTLREEWKPEPAAKAAKSHPVERGEETETDDTTMRATPPTDGGRRAAPSEPSTLFLELVATLAQQAEMLLLGAPGLPKQPEQAKRLIDYLGALESKTEGNLTAEEKQLLSNAIFQLRTAFVQQRS